MKGEWRVSVLFPDESFKSQSVICLEKGTSQPRFLTGSEGQVPLPTHIEHIFLVRTKPFWLFVIW